MPLPQDLTVAAEQVAKNAPITEGQRNALKRYLTAAYSELRYTADELFLRRLLKCCACLTIYSDRDRVSLSVWLSKILEEIEK